MNSRALQSLHRLTCGLTLSLATSLAVLQPFSARAADPAPAAGGVPTIFVCGDSTARNSGASLGWGTPLADYFDSSKAVVNNVAHAGTSSRTYYNGDWPKVLPQIKAGDYVLVVFGINDGGPPMDIKGRGSIPGIGAETRDLARPDGTAETAHTYGWYLAKYVADVREKGAHPVLLTVTVRDIWTNPKATFRDAVITHQEADYNAAEDRVERGTANGKYTEWTMQVAKEQHTSMVNLTMLLADQYERMGREKVMVNFNDHNHTKPAGAEIVASAVVSGLKALPNSPFTAWLSEKGKAVAAADAKYVAENPPAAGAK